MSFPPFSTIFPDRGGNARARKTALPPKPPRGCPDSHTLQDPEVAVGPTPSPFSTDPQSLSSSEKKLSSKLGD
jgi:hypothetical protein